MLYLDDSFDDIRPYNQKEAEEAIQRIAVHPLLPKIAAFLFPEIPFEDFKNKFKQLKSTNDFQQQVMDEAIWNIVKKTSSGLSFHGFENLEKEKSYLFISNHRDILLDSAILQILLFKHGLKTSEITFGNNLMKGDFVIDIGKLNKMFKIIREGNFREFYRSAARFSAYMRHTITHKKESIWIAQRNGRTKDGFDATETGVLKMFAMSSQKVFVENMAELNIVPISISYEFEPCDFLKTFETYVSRRVKYTKGNNEDLNSIINGITQWKGDIHLTVTPPVTVDELMICDQSREKFKSLTQLIDNKIYTHYKLWPNNYLAHDLLNETERYINKYTPEQKNYFLQYMNKGLNIFEGDIEELRNIFLTIYANPVLFLSKRHPFPSNCIK